MRESDNGQDDEDGGDNADHERDEEEAERDASCLFVLVLDELISGIVSWLVVGRVLERTKNLRRLGGVRYIIQLELESVQVFGCYWGRRREAGRTSIDQVNAIKQ